MRDICPLNEEGEPIVNLKIEDCWTIGPFEKKLAKIQMNYEKRTTSVNKMTRIELRKLFEIIKNLNILLFVFIVDWRLYCVCKDLEINPNG